MKLNKKKDLNVLYKVCVFRADRKNKMANDWPRHFRLLLWNRWTEFDETWQEAISQRPLQSLCVWTDRKNKMAALASDWLRHYRLLLWNRWTEFNETWQQGRSQRPLQSLCFSGRSEKQDGRPGFWLAETFSTSPLKPLNGIWRNLTGSKILTSSTKFVFFGPIGKTRWPPWPLIGADIFDFSSETAERPATKLDRKQNLNVLYQVGVFWLIWKTRWPPWPIRQKGGTLYSGARLVALWASCFDWATKKLTILFMCTICGPLGPLFFSSPESKAQESYYRGAPSVVVRKL